MPDEQLFMASSVVLAETPVFARMSADLLAATARPAEEAVSAAATERKVMPLLVHTPQLQLDAVRWLDPGLSAAIATVRPVTVGVPRGQLTVPVSPSAEVVDTLLFETVADPAQKLYVPRYRLATEQTAAGGEHYRVALKARAPGWALTVHLEKYPAPEIEEAARSAMELPHQAAVILRFSLGGTGIEKELVFADVVAVENRLEATLQVNTLPEQGELYDAMTRHEARATLIVRRAVEVAIPVGSSEAGIVGFPPPIHIPFIGWPIPPIAGPMHVRIRGDGR